MCEIADVALASCLKCSQATVKGEGPGWSLVVWVEQTELKTQGGQAARSLQSCSETELWRRAEGPAGVFSWVIAGLCLWGNYLRLRKNLPEDQKKQKPELTWTQECSFTHQPEWGQVSPGPKDDLILLISLKSQGRQVFVVRARQ